MKEYFVSITLRSELNTEDLKNELYNVLEGLRRKEGIEKVPSILIQKRDSP